MAGTMSAAVSSNGFRRWTTSPVLTENKIRLEFFRVITSVVTYSCDILICGDNIIWLVYRLYQKNLKIFVGYGPWVETV